MEKPSKLLIVGAAVVAISLIMGLIVVITNKGTPLQPSEINESERSQTLDEKTLIDDWISANNLNEYGDPKDTVYTGGTPLFDELTGVSIDRYEYIKRNHPNRPWSPQ